MPRPNRELASELGSVTAELAMALPVLTIILSIFGVATQALVSQVQLAGVAASTARSIAVGEVPGLPPGVSFERQPRDSTELFCIEVRKNLSITLLGARWLRQSETACAKELGS